MDHEHSIIKRLHLDEMLLFLYGTLSLIRKPVCLYIGTAKSQNHIEKM